MWSMLRILGRSQKRYAPVAYAAEYATTLELSTKDLITDTYCNLFVNTRQGAIPAGCDFLPLPPRTNQMSLKKIAPSKTLQGLFLSVQEFFREGQALDGIEAADGVFQFEAGN